jgi:hypothetical protein
MSTKPDPASQANTTIVTGVAFTLSAQKTRLQTVPYLTSLT